MKKGFHTNIEELTLANSDFRRVLYTSQDMQLVLMCLKPGEEIGEEIHNENDQFFRVESGSGECTINENKYKLFDGVVLIVPAGAKHNIINTSNEEDLKLYTIYSPPHHKDATIHHTKEDALNNDEEFDGVLSE